MIDRQSAIVHYNNLEDTLKTLEEYDLPEEQKQFKEGLHDFLQERTNLVYKLQKKGREDLLKKLDQWQPRIQKLVQKLPKA